MLLLSTLLSLGMGDVRKRGQEKWQERKGGKGEKVRRHGEEIPECREGIRKKKRRSVILRLHFDVFPKLAASLTVPLILIKPQIPAQTLLKSSPNTFHTLGF